MAKQKTKSRLTLMQRIQKALIPGWKRKELLLKTREFRRWENGWKRHCSSRGMIRRIGNRQNAIKLGIIKA